MDGSRGSVFHRGRLGEKNSGVVRVSTGVPLRLKPDQLRSREDSLLRVEVGRRGREGVAYMGVGTGSMAQTDEDQSVPQNRRRTKTEESEETNLDL